MGALVNAGTQLMCSFGAAPSSLNVPFLHGVLAGAPAANIMDQVPLVNVMPFGACSCPANPMVASATAAALGTLTPMPCIPVLPAPWMPGAPTVLVGNLPSVSQSSTLICCYGGVITIVAPAQVSVTVP